MTTIGPSQPPRPDVPVDPPGPERDRSANVAKALRAAAVEQLIAAPAARPQRERSFEEEAELTPPEIDDFADRDEDDSDPDPAIFREIGACDITFHRASPAPPWYPPGLKVVRRRPHSGTGVAKLGISVRAADRDVMGDAPADDYEQKLRGLAATIAQVQSAAIRASSLPEAYRALVAQTQDELAEAAEVTTDWLSRRNGLTVSCPWGVVPVEFFWWKGKVTSLPLFNAVPAVAALIEGGTDRRGRVTALARRALAVAGEDHHGADTQKLLVGGLRKLIPDVFKLLDNPEVVASFSARMPWTNPSELAEALGLKRAEWVAAMALCGALVGPGK